MRAERVCVCGFLRGCASVLPHKKRQCDSGYFVMLREMGAVLHGSI